MTKSEATSLFDAQRRTEGLACAATLLLTGLSGLSERERHERVFSKLKGALQASELPPDTSLTTPSTRSGTPAPISFLNLHKVEIRKKAAAALKTGGMGARVANGPSTERLNRFLIAAAKDVGGMLKLDDTTQRKRIIIDFRNLTVALDGKVFCRRTYCDVFEWEGQEPGDLCKKLRGV